MVSIAKLIVTTAAGDYVRNSLGGGAMTACRKLRIDDGGQSI